MCVNASCPEDELDVLTYRSGEDVRMLERIVIVGRRAARSVDAGKTGYEVVTPGVRGGKVLRGGKVSRMAE